MLRRRLYTTLFRARLVTLSPPLKGFRLESQIVLFIMSSSQQSRLRVAFEIERYDVLVDIACERYSLFDRSCIVMEDSSSYLKYLKCVRASKSCVNMSWSFLDHNRENLFVKIAKDEALLTIVII